MTNNEIKLNKKATDYLKNKIGGGGSSSGSGSPYLISNYEVSDISVGKTFDVDNFIALCEEKNVSLILDTNGGSIELYFTSSNEYDYILRFYYYDCAGGNVISINGIYFYKVVDETSLDLKALLLANKSEIEALVCEFSPVPTGNFKVGIVEVANFDNQSSSVMLTYQEVISLFKDVE